MKLYHHPFSSNARKAVMTALMLGCDDVELVVVDLPKREQHAAPFLTKNPNGKVPVLVDGDLSLWESGAIMAYLADKKGPTPLYPAELRARADVNRWLFWAVGHWTPPIGTLNWENMLKRLFTGGDPDESAVARAHREIATFGKVLDDHLADREWICGDGVTLADVAVACPLMTTVPAKLPVTTFANVQRWFARVQELPAWKETSAG